MTTLSRRNVPKLLSTVGGKPHANDKDHEETYQPEGPKKTKLKKEREEEERLLNAEPESESDDDLQAPPPPPPTKDVTGMPDTALKTAPKASSRRKPTRVQAPRQGTYQAGKADKAKRELEEEKENSTAPQSDTGFDFDIMAFPEKTSKGQKTQYGAKAKPVRNLHGRADKNRINTQEKKANVYGKTNHVQKAEIESDNDDDSDACSMKSNNDAGRETISKPPKRTRPSTLEDDELRDLSDPTNKRSKTSSNPARLLEQLGDWKEGQSSPPDSNTPREDLDKMDAYVAELKEMTEVTQCVICETPVDENVYAEFWYGKPTTVKNQTAFCSTHKRIAANEEYENAGYPKIDWDALPRRVKKHRKELYKVLTNDRSSRYRDRYEPIALTGKAGAIRSRRKDRPQDEQDEDTSFVLDDCNTYPGYYGPRGRRAITETIMKELRNEIKSCTDAVVQTSGPAAFVQAVLVPEVAVLLIMEDCMVDGEEAEQIRENTYDMGLHLHEEIEDEVDVQDESDDENEYRHK
ncbi:hypothetical protein P153DRAFT_284022 [Dothidotthia symphoricarpi CBS 119687]|uniref:Restriction of telomere capping protein 4 n=1 Tax=Dothidotthia symphoricarpi CBS 119687 TaxID=1392245 RepID=A0A6A6AQ29_9PLEO|nr:uncharacterized protein P153DRAFT_284022 [Dothidotthia symphoricarpi CBS 119687]KAF2132621.1 hypothetical protein P153DRAFT_284022 [Dothidotthia symphoricarpi CBS 119687]